MLGNDPGFKTFVTTTPVPLAVVLFGVGGRRAGGRQMEKLQTLTHAVFSLGIDCKNIIVKIVSIKITRCTLSGS